MGLQWRSTSDQRRNSSWLCAFMVYNRTFIWETASLRYCLNLSWLKSHTFSFSISSSVFRIKSILFHTFMQIKSVYKNKCLKVLLKNYGEPLNIYSFWLSYHFHFFVFFHLLSHIIASADIRQSKIQLWTTRLQVTELLA